MSEQGNKNGDNTTAAWGPLKTNLMSAMNSNTRVTSFVLFSVLLVVVALPAQQLPQENKPLTDRELELLAVRGKWAMYSRDTGATPPDPPPPNASYKDAAKLKPFQTIPRVQIFLTEGRLFGEAVFPDGIVLTDENADVTGKEPVPVQGIQVQDGNLSFKVQVGSELIEARLSNLTGGAFWEPGDPPPVGAGISSWSRGFSRPSRPRSVAGPSRPCG